MTRETKCKFCGAVVRLRIADECPPLQLEKWLAMASCNRCADYRMGILTAREAIRRRCQVWFNARLMGPAETEAIKPRVRLLLELGTQALCRAACQYWHAATNWRPELVDVLMERPELADRIVNDYVKRTEYLCRQPAPEHREVRPVAPDP